MAALTSPSTGTSRRGAAPNAHVIPLVGEYDLASVAPLTAMLARTIAEDEADLVIDLSRVEFFDAASITVIIRARAFLLLHGRSLVLRAPSAFLRRILEVCSLEGLLEPESGPGVELAAARTTRLAMIRGG